MANRADISGYTPQPRQVHLLLTDRIGRRKRSMPMPAYSVSTPDVLVSKRRNVCQSIPTFLFLGIRENVTAVIGWIEPPEQVQWDFLLALPSLAPHKSALNLVLTANYAVYGLAGESLQPSIILSILSYIMPVIYVEYYLCRISI